MLADAARAIEEGRWADAATALIAAWQAVPCGRIARALAIVDIRLPPPEQLDDETNARREEHWHELAVKPDEETLRRLLATPWPTFPNHAQRRVEALAAHRSPRISNALLGLYRARRYASRSGNVLYRMILKQLLANDDPAVTEEIERSPEDAAMIGKAILRRKRPAIPVHEDEASLARIEALLSSGSTTREALLAAIYQAPHDDAPRLVYADALSETGDPRGEFIALQLQNKNERRQKQLLRAAGESWFDGLPTDGATNIELARGFPVRARVGGELRVPAWATIERLDVDRRPLRGSHLLRGLRELVGLHGRKLPALELPHWELEYVAIIDYYNDVLAVETPLAPRILGLDQPGTSDAMAAIAREIHNLPIGRRVEVMRLPFTTNQLALVSQVVEETGLVIEMMPPIAEPHSWIARVTAETLHLHWTDNQIWRDQPYDWITRIIAGMPPPGFQEVTISGVTDGDVKNQLEAVINRWPSLEKLRFADTRDSW